MAEPKGVNWSISNQLTTEFLYPFDVHAVNISKAIGYFKGWFCPSHVIVVNSSTKEEKNSAYNEDRG